MKLKKNLIRGAAIGGVTTMALTMAAPGYAAPDDVVAQSTAEAFDIAIAGNSAIESGEVRAEATAANGGETTRERPPIDVLNNQGLVNVGAATQQAQARIEGRRGLSAACAGIAGDGGSVTQVGEGNCLTATDNFGINVGNLDLSGVIVIDERSALGALGEGLNVPLEQLLSQITAPISEGLSNSPLSNLALAGTASVIEGRCAAQPGAAQGSATLANARLTLTPPGEGAQPITIASFDASPKPNTEVVTELDQVLTVITDAIRQDLNESFDGAGAALNALIDPIQEQLVENVIGQIAPQLGPIEENLLRGTLNKQTTTGNGQIEVTALDLEVFPAAAQSPAGAPLADIEIGRVTCGPNGLVTAGEPEGPQAPQGPAGPAAPALPAVPTAVDSGTEGQNGALLGGLMLALAGAVAATGYRRAGSRG